MPQFRFRATTPEGKTRSGRVTATDRNQAQQRIEEFGLTLVELSEGSGQTLDVAKSLQGFLSVDRVGAYFPAASLSARLARWSDWGITGNRLAALLVSLGLVWSGLSWVRQAPRAQGQRARGASEMSDQLFSQTLRGQISAPAGCNLSQSELEISFPEIPCQFSQPWDKLKHPSANQFVWQLEFLAPKKPTFCSLQVRLKDYRLPQPEKIALTPALSEIRLRLEPASSESPN